MSQSHSMALAAVDCGEGGENSNDEFLSSLAHGFPPASDMISATTLEPPIGSLDRVVESEQRIKINDQEIYEVFYHSHIEVLVWISIHQQDCVPFDIPSQKCRWNVPSDVALERTYGRQQKIHKSESETGKNIEEQMALGR